MQNSHCLLGLVYHNNFNAIPDFGMDWVQIITRGTKNAFFFRTEKKRLKDTNHLKPFILSGQVFSDLVFSVVTHERRERSNKLAMVNQP